MKKRPLDNKNQTVSTKKSKGSPSAIYIQAEQIIQKQAFADDLKRVTAVQVENKIVLKTGFKTAVKSKEAFKRSPLHRAIAEGDEEKIRILLQQEQIVRLINPEIAVYPIPLFWACLLGQENIVNCLLDKEADAKFENKEGYSALSCALVSNHPKILAILLERCPDILQSQTAENCIVSAESSISSGKIELLIDIYKKTLEQRNEKSFLRYSILLYILGFHSLSPLLSKKEVEDFFNEWLKNNNEMLIKFILKFGNLTSFDYLLKSSAFGKSIENWRSTDEGNIAHYLNKTSHCDLINKYYPALLDQQDRREYPPIAWAVGHGRSEIVQWFLDDNPSRIKMQVGPKRGNLMHQAVEYNQLQIFKDLWDTYPDQLEEDNKDSHNPVEFAIIHGKLEILQELVSQGEDQEEDQGEDQEEDKILDLYSHRLALLAAGWGKTAMLRWLVNNNKVRLQKLDSQGNNVAHRAVQYTHPDILSYLLTVDSSLFDQTNFSEKKPFDMALENQNTEVLQWFLEKMPHFFHEIKNKIRTLSFIEKPSFIHFLYKNFPHCFVSFKLWRCLVTDKNIDEILASIPLPHIVIIKKKNQEKEYEFYLVQRSEKLFKKLSNLSNQPGDFKFNTDKPLEKEQIPKAIYSEIFLKQGLSNLLNLPALFSATSFNSSHANLRLYFNLFNIPMEKGYTPASLSAEETVATKLVTIYAMMAYAPIQIMRQLPEAIILLILEYSLDYDNQTAQLILYGLSEPLVKNRLVTGYLENKESILQFTFTQKTISYMSAKIIELIKAKQLDAYQQEIAADILKMVYKNAEDDKLIISDSKKNTMQREIYQAMKTGVTDTPFPDQYQSVANSIYSVWRASHNPKDPSIPALALTG